MSQKRQRNTFMVDVHSASAASPVRQRLRLGFLGAILLTSSLAWPQQKPSSAVRTGPEVNMQLLQVKRICVHNFGGDTLGFQVQEMIIAKLYAAKRFSLTEDCERADYVLKGSVTERDETTQQSESEGVAGIHTSNSSTQRKQQSVITLRLVDKDGEILWATSEESSGGKTKGAIGMAVQQAVRQLLREIERAEKRAQSLLPKK